MEKQAIEAIKLPIFGILAIDPAMHSGWAFASKTDGTEFGNFILKDTKINGKKWIQYEKFLNELIDECTGITNVIYEMPVMRHSGAMIHHSKLACLIEKVSTERGLICSNVDPKTLKKFITNNGNAGKDMMVAFIEKYFQIEGNDNIADAISILLYKKFITRYGD
jgi:Holliday junction resolvasome RuvABC endonuclease subunit